MFGTTTLNNTYQFATDIFLVKYNASGDVQWAKSAGGNTYDYSYGVAADNNGNINLTGTFRSNEITFGTTTLINTGEYDFFIAQFDAAGGTNWAISATGDGYDTGTDVEADNSGNVFVAGYFAGTSISFGTNTLPGNGYDNLFILKYSSGGNLEWVRTAEGNDNDEALALAIDSEGGVVVTGEFASGTLTVGTFSLTNTQLDYFDLFVARIDTDGDVSWALSAGGNDDEYGYDVSTFGDGNVYVTGGFYSPEFFFGSLSLLNTNNSVDYFLAKIGSSTGIDDGIFREEFRIFPNPADDHLEISTSIQGILEINDLTGQTVLKTEVTAGSRQVDISKLTPGIYLVRVLTNDNITVNKLVKK
jgi:hypothetical protein